MKRLISMLLILTMAASLITGCGSGEQGTGAGGSAGDSSAVTVEDTMEELLEKIIAERPVEFMGGTTVLDLSDTSDQGLQTLKSFTGLDSADSITEAAAYEPMIGSIAFSLVLVRVSPDAESQDVAEAMKEGIDQRKWICVEADDLQVAGYGDVVMLIMTDSATELTSQSFVDAFQTVVGAEPSFVI